jgi:hypothetical protein
MKTQSRIAAFPSSSEIPFFLNIFLMGWLPNRYCSACWSRVSSSSVIFDMEVTVVDVFRGSEARAADTFLRRKALTFFSEETARFCKSLPLVKSEIVAD